MSDWRYVERFNCYRATIEVGGILYTVVHRAMGILGPRFYVGMRDGRDVTRPHKYLAGVIRELVRKGGEAGR